MVPLKTNGARFVLVSVSLVFLIGGCVYDPYYHDPRGQVDRYYDPYDYHYYPGSNVYFHFSTGDYYYHEHNRWNRTHVLPPHIYLHPQDRVRIKIKEKEPYLEHREHQHKYVPQRRPDYKVDRKDDETEREQNRSRHEDYRRGQDQSGRERRDRQ